MFGSTGKTVELIFTDGGKESRPMIASFRKEYYVQEFKIKKDVLLPIGGDIEDYDKLVAAGKYEGFQMNENGRLQAMLYRLGDRENPVAGDLIGAFSAFLSSKILKAVNYAISFDDVVCMESLRDIGAIPEDKKAKVKKLLSSSSSEALCKIADTLDGSSVEKTIGSSSAVNVKYKERLKKLRSEERLMKNGIKQLPEVLLIDGKNVAPKEYVELILAEYLSQSGKSATYRIEPYADEIAAFLDRDSLSSAIYSIYENTDKKEAVVPALVRFCTFDLAESVYHVYQKNKRTEAFAKKVILLNDTRQAMLIAEKEGMFEQYAAMRGVDAEQFRDAILYDFGFDINGAKPLDSENPRLDIVLKKDLSVCLRDYATGKTFASVPKKNMEPDRLSAVKKMYDEIKKNVKNAYKIKCESLLSAFLSGKNTSASHWQEVYLKNPLLKSIASLLIWQQGGHTFTVSEKGTIRADGTEYRMDESPVSLAHPMEMMEIDVSAWQNYLIINELRQPFEQMWESVLDPADIKEDRYREYGIPYYRFLNREKHGIRVDKHIGRGDDIDFYFEGCSVIMDFKGIDCYDFDVKDCFGIDTLSFKEYNRMTNHIFAYLDKVTVYERISKDDVSVGNILHCFTIAQIMEFIRIASENNCVNVLALLINYKNSNYPDFDPMQEFILEF